MNEEVKQEWTAALRSGEYEQAKNYLRTDTGYCCLGVLCDLAVKHEILGPPVATPRLADDGEYYVYDGSYSTLPNAVMEWAGLNKWNPEVPAPDGMNDDYVTSDGTTTLAELNDAAYSFAEIADSIDANL